MTYVYVLVSTEKDYYLEQAVLSVISLKNYNQNASVTLLTDKATAESFVGNRQNLVLYFDTIKPIDIPEEFDQKARSRWLKTSMRTLIEGDFLFIDCDTIICGRLNEIGGMPGDLYAALDSNVLISDSPFLQRLVKLKYIFPNLQQLYNSNKYFNSGVIYCKDTVYARQFFSRWHELWLQSYANGISLDQPAFNAANLQKDQFITELDGKWNCQLTQELRYLSSAKIIHYLATNEQNIYAPANPAILQEIRQNGIQAPCISSFIDNPRCAFRDTHMRIYTDEAVRFSETKLYVFYLNLFIRSKKLFNVLNSIYTFFMDIRLLILKKGRT